METIFLLVTGSFLAAMAAANLLLGGMGKTIAKTPGDAAWNVLINGAFAGMAFYLGLT